ncbi:General transcription factor II-I repeat domain-containing protein 2 [Eumeta japonica]|uniref:General transcription factor II-I repeat domain-containing protein 2 n=1 Tax=Eumeta variegata TaxID=151549 RepID=A0A4C1UPR8_EUMVA|nr:General transcription factor II-I repeat domain-containing protein 2 [Eumeta japonica]
MKDAQVIIVVLRRSSRNKDKQRTIARSYDSERSQLGCGLTPPKEKSASENDIGRHSAFAFVKFVNTGVPPILRHKPSSQTFRIEHKRRVSDVQKSRSTHVLNFDSGLASDSDPGPVLDSALRPALCIHSLERKRGRGGSTCEEEGGYTPMYGAKSVGRFQERRKLAPERTMDCEQLFFCCTCHHSVPLCCVRPLSLFYSDASADGVEERSLVPRSRLHARLRRNATISYAFSIIANDIKTTLTDRMAGFESFSIALDENTDLFDIAQLTIFIRGFDKEFTVTEELLALQPLKGITTG